MNKMEYFAPEQKIIKIRVHKGILAGSYGELGAAGEAMQVVDEYEL